MPAISNTMQWASVGIPLIEGVNTGVRARLAEPTNLVEALNVYYPRDGGPEKRLGYDRVNVNDPLAIPTNSTAYTYGYGAGDFTSTPFTYANIGYVKSIAKRDEEVVVQTNECLYNSDRKITDRFHCFSAETTPIAKTQNSQSYADMGDTGTIKVVAFRDLQAGDVKIYCYDSVTGTLKFSASADPADPEYLMVVPVGEYVHVYISNIADNTLYLHVVFPSDYELRTAIDLGECKQNFDTAKLNETHILVAKRTIADGIIAGYLNPDGTTNSSFCSFNTAVNIGGVSITGFACAIHPDTTVGFIWDQGALQRCRTYTIQLASLGSIVTASAHASCQKVALTHKLNEAASFFFWSDNISTTYHVNCGYFNSSAVTAGTIMYNVHLCGKAFSIGAAQFVWVCRPSTLQTSYLVLNSSAEVVGKLEYGTAVSNSADQWLFSSNVSGNTVHGALLYKRNILNQPGVFHEISIKEYLLDFDFRPRPAQAGRCLYYPGAQVWMYDGERVTEQGFHFTPEDCTYSQSPSGPGQLTLTGEYYYLIYPCHKNAQGEEVRGPAILSAKQTMTGTNDTMTIEGKTIPTLHPNSYFLIFRNTSTGTNWHLVSDRDPSSANCPKNDTTAATWSFVDTAWDGAIISYELDSFTSDNYLLPFSAPSCTILSYGKDRLWAAGGEIPDFQIWPSRLFTQYDTPSFHPALAIDIDKSLDKITAIGFNADYTVVFKKKKGYVINGDGLDNVLVGNNFSSQLALTDIGSTSSALRNISSGLVFQSEGNYRLMEPGGRVLDISGPVKDYLGDCLGMYLDIENTNIRMYQDNCTLVWDYAGNKWTKWSISCTANSDCKYIGKDRTVLVQGENYTDDGAIYEVRIKTSPFSEKLGGFQRVRRIAGLGEGSGTFTVNVYLDEREYPSDTFTISKPDNTSTWGSGTWGSGFWGDALGTGLFASDDRMRWVKRLTTQKCSCIALEIVYNGTELGPIHTSFVLEYGTKNGIDRSH